MSDDPSQPTPPAQDPPASPAEPQAAEAPAAPPVVQATQHGAPKTRASKSVLLRRFAFLAIPAIALFELLAHVVQTHSVVSDDEWRAARDAVKGIMQPDDLVAVAPYWADPIARQMFKDEILSVEREARPDATRFPRAIEVSMRGKHLEELAGWKVERVERVGPFTLSVLDNPAYRPLKDDLVSHFASGKMSVSVVGGGGVVDCAPTRGRVETGGLGFGPAIAAERFACPQGGTLTATVMQPADYRPHRCLFAPPLGAGKTMRVRFTDVAFGEVLHGHAGIDWDSTAHVDEPPVTLVWKLGDRTIGRVVAGNNDGWKGFELDTRELAGQSGEVVAEISSPSSHDRLYCFEADTR